MDNKLIPDEARKWLGTPFHHQGRLLGVGVDCLGLMVSVINELGGHIKDRPAYSRYPTGGYLIAGMREQLTEIDIADATTGDFFVSAERKHANHVMIYDAETGTVIHSYYQNKMVVEQPRAIMDPKIIGAFRYER